MGSGVEVLLAGIGVDDSDDGVAGRSGVTGGPFTGKVALFPSVELKVALDSVELDGVGDSVELEGLGDSVELDGVGDSVELDVVFDAGAGGKSVKTGGPAETVEVDEDVLVGGETGGSVVSTATPFGDAASVLTLTLLSFSLFNKVKSSSST